MKSLLEAFHVDQVDQSELELVLQGYFAGALAESTHEIHYRRQQEPSSLIVHYSKETDRILAMEPGPALKPADILQIIERIEQLLLGPQEMRIGQTALFSRLAFKGWMHFGDRFRLIPMPPDAPRPTITWGVSGYPLLMQFRFAGSADPQLQNLRHFAASRELELLCAALCLHLEGSILPVTRFFWAGFSGGDPPVWRSQLCPEQYIWPGANALVADYSRSDDWQPVPRKPHAQYYSDPGYSVGQEVMLPDTFEELLEMYFQRPPEERDQFIRASHWYQFASRAAGRSYTAGYNALCSAVESLMGPEPKSSTRCPTCRRPTGGGVRKRFKEFLRIWAPNPAFTDADRSRLYDLRNMGAHGGRLLRSDKFGWGLGLSPSHVQEYQAQVTMQLMVRTILVNWLAKAPGPDLSTAGPPRPQRGRMPEWPHELPSEDPRELPREPKADAGNV